MPQSGQMEGGTQNYSAGSPSYDYKQRPIYACPRDERRTQYTAAKKQMTPILLRVFAVNLTL
jgi:hypothetical protein